MIPYAMTRSTGHPGYIHINDSTINCHAIITYLIVYQNHRYIALIEEIFVSCENTYIHTYIWQALFSLLTKDQQEYVRTFIMNALKFHVEKVCVTKKICTSPFKNAYVNLIHIGSSLPLQIDIFHN